MKDGLRGGMVRRHARARAGRRHLDVAARQRRSGRAPVEVANWRPAGRHAACRAGTRCCSTPGTAALTLFYKVGPSPSEWWGMALTSRDGGQTWSDRTSAAGRRPRANQEQAGAARRWHHRQRLEHRVAPSSPSVWRVHFERSERRRQDLDDRHAAGGDDGARTDAIQPAILVHPDGRLQAVGRTRSQRMFETWSSDARPHVDAAGADRRCRIRTAGIDAVTLRDGRHLIVYNHTTQGRTPLNVAVSRDGKTWSAPIVLESEPGEYSYPAVIQTSDGMIHVTYTWKRERIKHVVINPTRLPASH